MQCYSKDVINGKVIFGVAFSSHQWDASFLKQLSCLKNYSHNQSWQFGAA